MRRVILAALILIAPALAETHFVIVTGLGGDSAYEKRFAEEGRKLAEAARAAAAEDSSVHLLQGESATLDSIVKAFTELQGAVTPEDSLALYLIGHGSYSDGEYKFNIPGPDLTASRLANLLDPLKASRQLVVVGTSCSGGAIEALNRDDRAVITATKSGRERTATHFSRYWTEAFESPETDVNKDEAITADEAYRYAERKIESLFKDAQLLATEHPQLEGKLTSGFILARHGAAAAAMNDPLLAPLIKQRSEIELQIERLKLRKDSMGEEQYFNELQELLILLAQIEDQIANRSGAQPKEEKP